MSGHDIFAWILLLILAALTALLVWLATERLPAGTTGAAAIFTDRVKISHAIRRVLLRQVTILNYVNPF